jgi:trk system potassium uptake protein TrkA
MKKQIVVVGLGRFGVSVATTLHSMGHDVLALDKDEQSVANVASQLTRAVQADATNEAILKELGIADFDVAIVAIGTAVESSVLATILLKKLGVPYIIARAENELHGSILEKIGADSVVYPEREMGVRTAHGMTLRDASDYMSVSHQYGVAKLPALPHLVGGKLSDLGFGSKGRWGVAVLLIQRKNEIIVTPRDREVIKSEDVLIVAGSDDKIEKLLSEAKKNKKGD